MIDITLAKAKYRERKVSKSGRYVPRTGNTHGKPASKGQQGTGPRRRQGLGAVGTGR